MSPTAQSVCSSHGRVQGQSDLVEEAGDLEMRRGGQLGYSEALFLLCMCVYVCEVFVPVG
jgi:hypothetical protein